ncbi:MAG: bifunctional diaminohydroxyphosphoribosylaminopyrimidine deaminase/5-amino-6-(5-phosphoribosylamino)uracil reductase RibD [Proteobacteria bacterium]|nr:bifunctional diaminohydroxyphosphoribosylaminopyrimidine deaminase/5-amino-6-(5-phosphoribosylamino)uracil reductase RibD [Pseudomonadota bacterium]
MQDLDVAMMRLALAEARRGHPGPNPHVGALVARGSRVLARGHHRRAGEPHAEAVALKRAGRRARGATLYVTLEPCNHQGRTGPCVDAIVAAGISAVVAGCEDPAGHSLGGATRLQQAGVQVRTGVLVEPCRELVADFAKLVRTGMPWVTLKAAVTLDGRMATRTGDSKWITGLRARREAHRLRASHGAVLVGIGTVLVDDPVLTVRHVRGPDPLRVVLDSRLRTPPTARLASGPEASTLIFHAPDAYASRRLRLTSLAAVRLQPVPAARRGLRLRSALKALGRLGVMRVLVEGGPTMHGAFLDSGLADAAALFVAPRIIGDERARSFAEGRGVRRLEMAWRLRQPGIRRLGEDVMLSGKLEPGG